MPTFIEASVAHALNMSIKISKSSNSRELVAVLLPSLVLTFLNAAKPIHMDDAFYWEFARHTAHHPLDPYGFALIYFGWPELANRAIAPPVVPYWWGAAIAMMGNHPVFWKLS